MLTRIRGNGYKSLKRLDLKLADLSVLFGPNAAGKSNFLDCLQLLSKTLSGSGGGCAKTQTRKSIMWMLAMKTIGLDLSVCLFMGVL